MRTNEPLESSGTAQVERLQQDLIDVEFRGSEVCYCPLPSEEVTTCEGLTLGIQTTGNIMTAIIDRNQVNFISKHSRFINFKEKFSI